MSQHNSSTGGTKPPTRNELYQAARHYLIKEGLSVLPCEPGVPEKRPLGPWQQFEERLPSELTLLDRFQQRKDITAIGMICGAVSGRVVVDVDPRNGGSLETAFSLGLPETRTVLTGGGGWHLHYSIPAGVKIPSRNLGNGIEIKAEGKFVVLPPSIHPTTGAQYVWDDPDALISPFPEHLKEIIRTAPGSPVTGASSSSSEKPPVADLLQGVSLGQRDDAAIRLAGRLVSFGLSDQECELLLLKWNELNQPPMGSAPGDTDPVKWVREKIASARRMEERTFTVAAPTKKPVAPTVRSGVRSIQLSEIAPEPVRHLIYPYLPRGEITNLEGDPGLGKSWIWMALTAGLTGSKVCKTPYDHTAKTGATVVVLTYEDSLGKTIRPRLEELGADLDRIHILFDDSGEDGITASAITAAIPAIERLRPDLIVVDPETLYLSDAADNKGNTLDTASANQVRAARKPLLHIARRLDCAVLVCRHYRKEGGRAIYRGLGSIDFVASARSVLSVGVDKRTGLHVLAHAKANLAPKGPSLSYELDPSKRPPFSWSGVVEGLSADDITDSAASERLSPREEAKEFLKELLRDGPVPLKEIEKQAKTLGISPMTLRRAKTDLGVEAKQKVGAYPPVWLWVLNG